MHPLCIAADEFRKYRTDSHKGIYTHRLRDLNLYKSATYLDCDNTPHIGHSETLLKHQPVTSILHESIKVALPRN